MAYRRAGRLIGLMALSASIFQLAACISTVLLLQLADFGLRGLLVALVGDPIP